MRKGTGGGKVETHLDHRIAIGLSSHGHGSGKTQ